MKNVIGLFSAAVIGGLTVVLFSSKTPTIHADKIVDQAIQPSNSTAKYTTNTNSNLAIDFTFAAEQTVNSVVHVKTEYGSDGTPIYFDPFDFFFGQGGSYQPKMPAMASGSGVVISADGYIVTNNHVVADADKISITLNNNKTYKAELIGKDPTTDIALLKISATELSYVPYGNSDDVKIGEWVLAVGNPFNLTSTVTAGIVSAKGRDINILNDAKGNTAIESFIQTDAAVNPGNSGGALVNTKGKLVGINTAIKSNTGSFTGYSFAVPVNIVKKVVDDLLEYGVVQRGYIGVSIRNIDSEFASEKDLSTTQGVYISEVLETGAADEAGLKTGDVITKIGNTEVSNIPELQEQVGSFRPGDEIIVTVNRNEKEIEYSVTLKNKNGNTKLYKREFTKLNAVLGGEFRPASDLEKQKLRISSGLKVKTITSGKLRSAGIKEGFIITKIDQTPINSYEQMARILENKKGGVLIEGIYQNGMKAYYGFGI
ncbi:MAG: Do family serine endopeptidase [Flavobacteriales bacterium]|nr:Do family serine endopeptidase [Flavobacteriales bacterium]